jgi:hypothetical protein
MSASFLIQGHSWQDVKIPLLVQTDFGGCMDGLGCTHGEVDIHKSDLEAL